MKTLGVILARGGSKGIPKKNIVDVNGIPLIAHTIQAAIKSKIFSNLVVSTDCKKIADVSKLWGASVPFMRPDELAQDHVWSRDALKHAVLESEKIYKVTYDYVIELPCVAPLRNENHIKEVHNLLINNKVDSVTSVCQMADKHPVRMKRIVNGILKDFCTEFPEGEGSRRQDLEPCYIRNGAIYAMTRNCIVNKFSRHGSGSLAYVMDELSSVNIDTQLDLIVARSLLKARSES
jgi:CMP-N-acetylneuraminic acid synthetase